MGRIAFVTDSTAGVPKDQVAKYNVSVVPLQVIFGTEEFRDGIDITQEEFFVRLKAAKTLPTTSQPSVTDFEDAYRKLIADPGVDSIISVHLSSKLSGTFSAASQAVERMRTGTNKEITVIDSLTIYMCEGLMIINGARAAEQGKSHAEVVSLINGMIPRSKLILLVDTLEYLQKGGRIGGASALMGGLLNIKPVLQVKDGEVQPLEKVRTWRKGMDKLVEIGFQAVGNRPCQVAVGHADAAEDAATLGRMVRERLNVVEEFTSDLGPVICKHTGPGTLGFVYYPLEG